MTELAPLQLHLTEERMSSEKFDIISKIADIPIPESSDEDIKSLCKKKSKSEEEDAQLDKSQLAMVDLLMNNGQYDR